MWMKYFYDHWDDIEESIESYSPEQKAEIEEFFNELL